MLADEDPAAFDAHIEALTRELDASLDSHARRSAGELVRLILEFHRAGLRRLVRIIDDGPLIFRQRILSDPVLTGLLALHELEMSGTPSDANRQTRAGLSPLIQVRRSSEGSAARPNAHGEGPSACARCGEPLGASHHHHVDLVSRQFSCSCRACWLLSGVPGVGSIRAVPDRYLAGPSFRLTDSQWDALDVPVATVFFMHNSTVGRTIAFYPSPAGATESALSLEAWRDVECSNSWVRAAEPDVEAVLVRKAPGAVAGYNAYIVPIDACYDLVGRIRVHWRGVDGGDTVRAEIDRFFGDIAVRSARSSGSVSERS